MIGFFNVIRKKSISIELQLSQAIKIYNVFYSNLLWNAFTDPLIDEVNEPALPVIINNEEKWEVVNIFNARNHQNKI